MLEKDKYDLQFKTTKFKTEISSQCLKIEEEYEELISAVLDENDKKHIGEETCDVIVACLTLLKHNFTDEQIKHLFKFVNDKNRKRGYLEDNE